MKLWDALAVVGVGSPNPLGAFLDMRARLT